MSYTNEQLILIRISAKRALESGFISPREYQEVLEKIHIAERKNNKKSDMLKEASKFFTSRSEVIAAH